jgi:hypothetical protein
MKNYVDLSENTDSEKTAIENGYSQLSGKEIKEQLVGKLFLGCYLHGFQYIISINTDGSLEGKNNYQHYDIGSWVIDMEKHTMNVNWKHGWDNTTTRLYKVGKEIRMYDKETGEWRSSLKQYIDGVQNIKTYQFQ